MAGTSRINREVYVRFCGRLEVKFLRPTRRLKLPQAAAVKSRGGERWGQSVEDVPRAGKDQRDERK